MRKPSTCGNPICGCQPKEKKDSPPRGRQLHKAAGQTYYTLWRHGADAPMGLYCKTENEAEAVKSRLPEKYRPQFDIVAVKVIG